MTTQQLGKLGWTPERIGSLKGKTYVITGANSGAGYEASRICYRKEQRL
ncbi:probable oxidoreductase yajO1 [Vibrio astriarenae]|nr:probable oxidoreductase yajO1 [Vibrio sp. C7]